MSDIYLQYLIKRFSINNETCQKPNMTLMGLYYILLVHGISEKEDYYFNLNKNGIVFSFSLYDRIKKVDLEQTRKPILTPYAEKILNNLEKVLGKEPENMINYMASSIYIIKWMAPVSLNSQELFEFVNIKTENNLDARKKQRIFKYVVKLLGV